MPSGRSPEDATAPTPMRRVDPSVMGPVSKEELEAALMATPIASAPGPDGRLISDLKGFPIVKLR